MRIKINPTLSIYFLSCKIWPYFMLSDDSSRFFNFKESEITWKTRIIQLKNYWEWKTTFFIIIIKNWSKINLLNIFLGHQIWPFSGLSQANLLGFLTFLKCGTLSYQHQVYMISKRTIFSTTWIQFPCLILWFSPWNRALFQILKPGRFFLCRPHVQRALRSTSDDTWQLVNRPRCWQ